MYRGREGQWAFLLHRVSGIAIAIYLFIHVVNISLAIFGPDVANAAMVMFHAWPFRLGLLALGAGVIYHTLNGLRIILMDFSPNGVKYHRQLWYTVMILTVLIFIAVCIKQVPEILVDMGFGGN